MIVDFQYSYISRRAGRAGSEEAVRDREDPQLYGWDSDGYLAEDEAVEGRQRGLFEHCHEAFSAADHQWHAVLSMNDPRIIPFGSVHIDSEGIRLEELERVKKLGMKGIKLHPDYQGFFFDDPRAYPVYERCADLGLIVVIHAGSDPVSPGVIHADPQAIARVLDRFPRLILVAAHFGGTDCWDDVLRHLVGKQVYLDTALSAGNIPADTARQIIRAHGAHRILFGSDCPWHSSAMDAEFIRSLGLSEQEEEQIFYQNACALLGREQI